MTLAGSLAAALRQVARGAIRENEPLGPRSTIRLGGTADLWFEPAGAEDLVAGLRLFQERSVPMQVLGGGANTLISDSGLRGAVIHLTPGFAPGVTWIGEQEVELSAGLSGIKALQAARSRGLTGPEFLVGIPGTLGGQVVMNAGTPRGQMSDLLTGVQIAEPAGLRFIAAPELRFGYRHSELPPGSVVTRVRLRFASGDLVAEEARVREDMGYRRRTQPWAFPNLGSTFRNPDGDYAGRLLEAAGLKGERIGQVAFSTLHANFLTNLGGGRAAEAHGLIQRAKQRVRDLRGIALILEVALAGEF